MKKILLVSTLLTLSLMACNNKVKNQETIADKSYTTPDLKLDSDVMTPEVLWSFGRLGGISMSPDGKFAVYNVTYFNKNEDRSYSDLYLLSVNDSKVKKLTNTSAKEYDVRWMTNGKRLSYMCEGQLWEMDTAGTHITQVTNVEGGIGGYIYSPDETKLLFLKEVKLEDNVQDIYPDLPLAKARIIDKQFYRHWDHWIDTYTHPFIADIVKGQKIVNGKDIMSGEHWESPVRPWGGTEELTWTPDNKSILYTSRKKEGIEYAESTNSDIYKYDLETNKTINLTKGMMGYDKVPIISSDGKYLAWTSMEREGYEADKVRLYLMDLTTGNKKDLTLGFDQNVNGIVWDNNNENIWFISDYNATDEIYSVNIKTSKIKRYTDGVHNYTSLHPTVNGLFATRVSMSKPAELYKIDTETGNAKEVSFINKKILDQLTFGKVEKRWIKTTDNKQMLVWMIYPPHFDANKKYPALLYCEGGPQSTVSQFWSYRWNFQMMVAGDYIVVAPNRRGLPGFGQAWNEQISGDYSGQNIKDYLSAIDNAKKEPYIDANRLGCIGASYGGYSVYYLAGHHNKRFKAFIAHDGIFDLKAQYETTEEMWFANWDMGGAPWEKNNKIAQRTYKNSPDKFVGNWDTPILVIHGQKDFRIDVSQGMAAFNSARMRGIPARFLYFPTENHWVLGCQNGILWQRVFRSWLDKWLK